MNKIVLFLLTTCLCVSCVNTSKNNVEKESSSSESVDESTLDSLAVEEFRLLYNELMAFKDEPEFKNVGLAGKQEYIDWCNHVRELQDSQTERLMKKGLLPGELRTLADLYVSSKGKETKDTKYFHERFLSGLTQNSDNVDVGEIVKDNTSPKNVIGKWNAQSKFLPEFHFSVEIYEQDNKWFAEKVFYDGSGDKEVLKKNGNRYDIINNEFHEFYLIKAGQLQLGGEHGIIEDYIITKE